MSWFIILGSTTTTTFFLNDNNLELIEDQPCESEKNLHRSTKKNLYQLHLLSTLHFFFSNRLIFYRFYFAGFSIENFHFLSLLLLLLAIKKTTSCTLSYIRSSREFHFAAVLRTPSNNWGILYFFCENCNFTAHT